MYHNTALTFVCEPWLLSKQDKEKIAGASDGSQKGG